jgi:uncharacterized membrane protein
MRRFVRWLIFLMPAIIVCALGTIGVIWFELDFWLAIGLAIIAVVVNGWIAAYEDNKLGGFNNPKFHDSKSISRNSE